MSGQGGGRKREIRNNQRERFSNRRIYHLRYTQYSNIINSAQQRKESLNMKIDQSIEQTQRETPREKMSERMFSRALGYNLIHLKIKFQEQKRNRIKQKECLKR